MWWLILSSPPRDSSSWTSLFSQFAYTCSVRLLHWVSCKLVLAWFQISPPGQLTLFTQPSIRSRSWLRGGTTVTLHSAVVLTYLVWHLSTSQLVFVYSVFKMFYPLDWLITNFSEPHANVRSLQLVFTLEAWHSWKWLTNTIWCKRVVMHQLHCWIRDFNHKSDRRVTGSTLMCKCRAL